MENKKLTAQDSYNTFLSVLLHEHLFLSAKDVHEKLIDKFTVTPDYARKIVACIYRKIIG